MIGPGIPETHQEAAHVVTEAAAVTPGTAGLPHWPHSQIVSLSQLVLHLLGRVEQLEQKRKPGRPPKVATDATVELVAGAGI